MPDLQATPRVVLEWQRRIEAEYRSAAITQHLTLWLIQIGASPDLIRAGLEIVGDELTHAALSHEVVAATGAGAAPLSISREQLGIARHAEEPLEHDVLRSCVDVFCLGETVAVPLFKSLRQGCEVAVARRALDRILRDEVRHRDFGWSLLGWLLQLPAPLSTSLRGLLHNELCAMFRTLRQGYGSPESRTETDISPEERAWGLMPGSQYAAELDRTFDRDYRPRFARLQIDADPAWEQSRFI